MNEWMIWIQWTGFHQYQLHLFQAGGHGEQGPVGTNYVKARPDSKLIGLPQLKFKFQSKPKYHSWTASMWRIQDPIDDILIFNLFQFPLETQPTSRTGLRRWRSTARRKQGRRFLFRFSNIFSFLIFCSKAAEEKKRREAKDKRDKEESSKV